MREQVGADAFTELSPALRAALSDRGFDHPTRPQAAAIPTLVSGAHALILAPTGTGKTETAMLPVFDAITATPAADRTGIAALYITPLRALNRDMRQRLEWWGQTLDVRIDVRHGDTTQYQRQKQANDPPDVLVTTPETLQAMLTGSKLREALSGVQHVVVDEVHELASAKRGAQLTVALERLELLSPDFQRIGLSATVGSPAEVARFLTGDRPFEVIDVDAGIALDLTVERPTPTADDTTLAGTLATDEQVAAQVRRIIEIVEAHTSTLIFVNTRQAAEALGSRFNLLDAPIAVHHGSLSRSVRIDVEDRFKDGTLAGLVCTSSMELGIDVGSVDHVIQYGSPRQVARLLQRVGRAGHRQDRTSHGTIIATEADDILEAMIIARRALAGAVEPAHIHHASLDTVANQVAGVLMDVGSARIPDLHRLLQQAYPFRGLTEETLREVVEELGRNRVIWVDADADRVETSGGTWRYFYANLSMIPDEETFAVRDLSGRTQIGTLDERFVINFAEPGASFIQRGEMWRINDIDEEEGEVNVTPIEDPAGEVPSWTGAEIPVPAAVAAEMGELRREVARGVDADRPEAAIVAALQATYPATDAAIAAAIAPIVRQATEGLPIPTAEHLLLEGTQGTMVLNSCYGHRINETLARLVAALVGQLTGSSVGVEVGPYRIAFEVPREARPADITDVLFETDPAHLEALLELAIKHSEGLKFTVVQVAAKFGALKRYQGRQRYGADRLIDALEGGAIYREAVREIFHVDLAVDAAAALLERLQSDQIACATIGERTPLGIGGDRSGRDLIVPGNADAGVIAAIRDRIAGDRVRLLCLHCTDWERTQQVDRVAEQPECPRCEATQIACLNPWDEETPAAVRSADPDADARRQIERAYRSASLVQAHGRQAVIALAARGVGPQTAARIIGRLRRSETEFYRDILREERRYARTKAFWD